MTQVSKQQIKQWGSFSDRKDSFDDEEDINKFVEMVGKSDALIQYLINFIKRGDYTWSFHPDRTDDDPEGKYGVDLALVEKGTNKRIANFDLERRGEWKSDWPAFYKAIHFLGRKEKFLDKGVPFFMCYLNYNRDRVLVLEEGDIVKYPTINKHFSNGNVDDSVKRIPLSLGTIFGKYSKKESTLFQTGG